MGLLFVAATVTAIAARRKRDRCLKYFNREPVMVLMQSGKWLWGRFVAYPKAISIDPASATLSDHTHWAQFLEPVPKACIGCEEQNLTPWV